MVGWRRAFRTAAALFVTVTLSGPQAQAQTPSPAPPPANQQDVLDLRTRSNVVQGSGARAFGMAGAFLARPDDATAASWNPAGLSYLRTLEVSLVGATSSYNEDTFTASNVFDVQDRRRGRAPDFAALTHPVGFGSMAGAVQFSFQRVISYDADRTVRNANAFGAEERQPRSAPAPAPFRNAREFVSRGGFDVIAFGTGLQVSRQLRLGFTVNRWLNGYTQSLERTLTNRPTTQALEFDVRGWNLNLGAIWSPLESLNFGAVYKNGFTADVKLERSRTDFAPDGTLLDSQGPTVADMELSFPAAFGAGASWRPKSPLTISADYTRTKWSDARIRSFFVLTGATYREIPSVPSGGPPTYALRDEGVAFFYPESLPYPDLDSQVQQADTQQLRLGAEYVFLQSRFKWPLRAGYFADRQLFRGLGNLVPTFRGFTVGTGLSVGRVLLDVAYLRETGIYLAAPDLEADDQRFRLRSVKSHRIFASLIYRHRR